MKLYLISQTQNNDYDTYDSAVVAALTEESAKNINPSGEWDDRYSGWCKSPRDVAVRLIGLAREDQEEGVILSSFNAG